MGLSSALFLVSLLLLQVTLSYQAGHGGEEGEEEEGHGDMMDALRYMLGKDHRDHHEMLNEGLEKLMMALKDQAQAGESESDEYGSSHSHDSDSDEDSHSHEDSDSDEDSDEESHEGDGRMHDPAADNLRAAMVHTFLENEGPDSIEFSKKVVLDFVNQSFRPATDEQKLIRMYFDRIMADPHSDDTEAMLNMMRMLTVRQDRRYKVIQRMIILRVMSEEWGEDHKEVLKEMFHFLMSEEAGAGEMRNKESLLLLIQQLLLMLPSNNRDKERGQVTLMFMQAMMQDRRENDPAARVLLSKIVEDVITHVGNKRMQDTPMDEQWKFYPPTICRVEDGSGEQIRFNHCPHYGQCSVGPYTYEGDDMTMKFYLCAMPAHYMVYHACDVKYANDTTAKTQGCELSSNTECSFGPFDVTLGDEMGKATFCSSMRHPASWNWTMEDAEEFLSDFDQNIWSRACAMTDMSFYGFGQRRCPYTYSCTGGPLPVHTDFGDFHGFVCEEPAKRQPAVGDFLSDALLTLMGFKDWDPTEEIDDEEIMKMLLGSMPRGGD